jgi:phosphoacetylglucosamine mutase
MIRKYLEIEPVCTAIDTLGTLNANCGADYVKTGQRAPPAVLAELAKTADASSAASRRACSIDGDADRVIYYYMTANGGKEGSEGKFRLLDGDKIATLAAGFIGDLVRTAGLEGQIKLGVVQTAYANGSSTAYLKGVVSASVLELSKVYLLTRAARSLPPQNVPVKCVPTGVKHLHHAAERYDIGVYFEANGHGTVIFSPETLALLFSHEPKTPNQSTALTTLQSLTRLINQAVGDAVSDLLFVEVILALKKWGPEDWDAVYEDLPNRLVKVNVKDRSVFKTEDAERRLIEPAGLQAKVDEKVRMFEKGRSFVRPSGTEDCVRVYAEASTKVAADGESFR